MDATRRDTNPYVRDVSWGKGRGKGEGQARKRGGGNNVGGKRGCALFWVCFFPIFPFFLRVVFSCPRLNIVLLLLFSSNSPGVEFIVFQNITWPNPDPTNKAVQ